MPKNRSQFRSLPLRWLDGIGVLALFALFFVYVELLRANSISSWSGRSAAEWSRLSMTPEILDTYNTSSWSPMDAGDWPGVVLAFSLYAMALSLVFSLLHGISSYALGKFTARRPAVLGLAVLSAALVWLGICLNSQAAKNFFPTIVFASLCLFALMALMFWWVARIRPGSTAAACGIALLGGLISLTCVSESWILSDNRATISIVASIGWTAGGGLLILGVWSLKRGPLPALFFKGLVAFAVLALPLLSYPLSRFASAEEARATGDSILLVTSDTLRADYLSLYGGRTPTPALEAMAQRGASFKQFYSLAPWTLPSFTGMFSSAYPPSITPGARGAQVYEEHSSYRVSKEIDTLAQRLRDAGYATAAYVGNYTLPGTGVLRGFEQTRVLNMLDRERRGPLAACPFLHETIRNLVPRLNAAWQRPLDTSRILTRYAEEFLERNADGSFFLWVHYMDPHAPYDPPEKFRDRSGPWPVFAPTDELWGSPPYDLGGSVSFNTDAADKTDYVQSLYAGEIRYVDFQVAALMDALDELRLDETTFVCFTSDHGEGLWERSYFGHGHALFGEEVHVPLILTGPTLSRQVVSEPVSAIDLMPTLADLAGIEVDPSWRGESLAPLLRGEAGKADRPSSAFAQATGYMATEPFRAVVSGNFKLILGLETGSLELYDLDEDPKEENNLAPNMPGVVERLKEELDGWASSFQSDFSSIPNEDIPADMIERLKSLGYLD